LRRGEKKNHAENAVFDEIPDHRSQTLCACEYGLWLLLTMFFFKWVPGFTLLALVLAFFVTVYRYIFAAAQRKSTDSPFQYPFILTGFNREYKKSGSELFIYLKRGVQTLFIIYYYYFIRISCQGLETCELTCPRQRDNYLV
jgi:hypothetical protein